MGAQKVNGMWDTHSFFQTINHYHLSCLPEGDGDFADIMVVECKDGRWFLVEESGESGDDKLFDAYSEEFKEPQFFGSSQEAQEYAIGVISKVAKVSVEELVALYNEDE